MDVYDLANIVKNFEAVDEFAALLRVVQSRDHVRGELVFNSKVSLKVLVEKLEELLLQRFCGAALCEGEVFVVRKLAEVLLENIFEVVQHFVEGRDFCDVDKLFFPFPLFICLFSRVLPVHLLRCFCFRLCSNFVGLFDSLGVSLLFLGFPLLDDSKLGF